MQAKNKKQQLSSSDCRKSFAIMSAPSKILALYLTDRSQPVHAWQAGRLLPGHDPRDKTLAGQNPGGETLGAKP
jgi:hypothetical protein